MIYKQDKHTHQKKITFLISEHRIFINPTLRNIQYFIIKAYILKLLIKNNQIIQHFKYINIA